MWLIGCPAGSPKTGLPTCWEAPRPSVVTRSRAFSAFLLSVARGKRGRGQSEVTAAPGRASLSVSFSPNLRPFSPYEQSPLPQSHSATCCRIRHRIEGREDHATTLLWTSVSPWGNWSDDSVTIWNIYYSTSVSSALK